MTPEAELEKMKAINRILYLELKDYKDKNKELLKLCRKMEKQLLQKPIRKGSKYRDWETDRKSTRLNSSHSAKSRMPSSA